MGAIDSFLAGGFWLILAYLVLKNWGGANALLGTTVGGLGTTIKDFQGR